MHIPEPFGPIYPLLGATVTKFRKLAKAGVAAMPAEQRRAYGNAVLDSVRAKQRQDLRRELPSHDVDCASGTNYSDGEAILEAIRKQQRAGLYAPVPLPTIERERIAFLRKVAARQEAKYEAAMKRKHAAPVAFLQAAE